MSQQYSQNESYDISISNQTILIVCSVGFASLGIAFYFLILRHVPPSIDDAGGENLQNYDEFLNQSDVATLNRAERRARAKLRMKKARRAAIPARRDGDDVNANGPLNDDNSPMEIPENMGLNRRERQKAAKALEREERKTSAEIARARRENDQKKRRNKPADAVGERQSENECDAHLLQLEEILPLGEEGSSDPLDVYLFHGIITRKYKDNPQQFFDDSIDIKTMTIRAFIKKLQKAGFVSIAAIADDFGITSEEVINGLKELNDIHGIIGVFDEGNFVYVSIDMIERAMQMVRSVGKITCQD